MAGKRRAVYIGLAAVAVCGVAFIVFLFAYFFDSGDDTRVSVQLEPGGERVIVTMVLEDRRLRAVVDTRTGTVLEEKFSRIDPRNPEEVSVGSVSFRQVVNADEGVHLEWKKGEGDWTELTSDQNQLESLPVVSPDGEWAVFVRGWLLEYRLLGPKWTDYDMYQVEVASGSVTLFDGGPYGELDVPVFLGDRRAVTYAYSDRGGGFSSGIKTVTVGPDNLISTPEAAVKAWELRPGNGEGSIYACTYPNMSFDYTLQELTIGEDGSITIGKKLGIGTYITDFDSLYDSPIVAIIEDPPRSNKWELNLYDMETDKKTDLVSSETFLNWHRKLEEAHS